MSIKECKGNKSIYEWIFKRPSRAMQVYYKGGRKAAITEMCIGCVGSSQEARQCEAYDCPLWCFRPGATKGQIPSFIPPKEQLMKMKDE